jgi:radical SAM superfamily enzyme YgiQ (UPF0313 family)
MSDPFMGTMLAMLTLINTNRMVPAIGPIGLEYVAETAAGAGIEVDVLDLALSEDPEKMLREHLLRCSPLLIGLTFRNVDDCFWPSAQWFVPELAELVQRIRRLSEAPLVLGGVGFSIFAEQIVDYTGAEFGIRGDGEQATIALYRRLQQGGGQFEGVPGLVWRSAEGTRSNPPAWPAEISLPVRRGMVDNRAYLAWGGQCGFETKRGCNRQCLYCADPLAKGPVPRARKPVEIADEIEALLAQGIDVLHTCDAEFNVPHSHALAVCEELIRRRLGEKVRWYAYLAVTPFDTELAAAMRKAGCVGINFTGDSASEAMLRTYRQPHRKEDLATAVRLCREHGMKVMIDLLLGGPGETPQTAGETIAFVKGIAPDCAGASLGLRVYPGTGLVDALKRQGPLSRNPGLRRKYAGPVDLFLPTFYVSPALGPEPARLIKDLIAGDPRFFEPMAEQPDAEATDHNYNDNTELVEAIRQGARGAYWDVLRQRRGGSGG